MRYLVTYEIDTTSNALFDGVTPEHLEAMVANPPSNFLRFVKMRQLRKSHTPTDRVKLKVKPSGVKKTERTEDIIV